MPGPDDTLRKATSIGPAPRRSWLSKIGDAMTSSAVNPVVNFATGEDYGEEPGPVDLALQLTGLIAASKGVMGLGKRAMTGADEALTPISKDPMGLKDGPMDRRNFLYRASGLPETKRVKEIASIPAVMNKSMDLAGQKIKLVPREPNGNIDWDKLSDKLHYRIQDLGYGGDATDNLNAILDKSPAMRDHFQTGMDGLFDGGEMEAHYYDWEAGQELPDGIHDFIAYNRSSGDEYQEMMVNKFLADKVRRGEILKSPGPDLTTGPSALGGILKRFGAELKPHITKEIAAPVEQAITKDAPSAVDSILKRFGIDRTR